MYVGNGYFYHLNKRDQVLGNFANKETCLFMLFIININFKLLNIKRSPPPTPLRERENCGDMSIGSGVDLPVNNVTVISKNGLTLAKSIALILPIMNV